MAKPVNHIFFIFRDDGADSDGADGGCAHLEHTNRLFGEPSPCPIFFSFSKQANSDKLFNTNINSDFIDI